MNSLQSPFEAAQVGALRKVESDPVRNAAKNLIRQWDKYGPRSEAVQEAVEQLRDTKP